MESRSKLLVRTLDIGTEITPLITGKSLDHVLDDTDYSATVYVVLEDKDGDALVNTDVLFTVSSQPADIVSSTRTEGTKRVITNGSAESDEILLATSELAGRDCCR